MHKYSVNTHSRVNTGKSLALLASYVAGIASWFVAQAVALLTEFFGIAVPTLILWPLSAFVIFTFIYGYYKSNGWSYTIPVGWIDRFRAGKVPNLNGRYHVNGKTEYPEDRKGYEWSGELIIRQNYEEITIELKTENSRSESSIATLILDKASKARLRYIYDNKPNPGSEGLSIHTGFAEILFDKSFDVAEAVYFNHFGRRTQGTMKITRSV